jgi:hypothetical protein
MKTLEISARKFDSSLRFPRFAVFTPVHPTLKIVALEEKYEVTIYLIHTLRP